MDSRDWVLLKIIHEEGSLSKTAERLYTSQPSLTYRLNHLENEFGIKILNRRPNGVTFTPQGEAILKYFEEMMERLARVKADVLRLQNSVRGILKLGVSSVYARFKLASILKTYKELFPEVEIGLTTGSSTLQLPQMLRSNEVDLVIVRGDLEWPENKHVILEEPYGIISAQPTRLDQLPDMPCILDDAAFLTKFNMLLESWWSERFPTPRPPSVIQVDSVEACIQLASHGMGWTIQPKIHLANRRSLFFHPLAWMDNRPFSQQTIMAYREKALEKPAVKLFVEYILDECILHL